MKQKLPHLYGITVWDLRPLLSCCWGYSLGLFIFPYIGNVIIPTDELIFFRGVGLNHQPVTVHWKSGLYCFLYGKWSPRTEVFMAWPSCSQIGRQILDTGNRSSFSNWNHGVSMSMLIPRIWPWTTPVWRVCRRIGSSKESYIRRVPEMVPPWLRKPPYNPL